MAKAKILSVTQTEKAGLFTIIFEGESYDEFQKCIEEATIEGVDDKTFDI